MEDFTLEFALLPSNQNVLKHRALTFGKEAQCIYD